MSIFINVNLVMLIVMYYALTPYNNYTQIHNLCTRILYLLFFIYTNTRFYTLPKYFISKSQFISSITKVVLTFCKITRTICFASLYETLSLKFQNRPQPETFLASPSFSCFTIVCKDNQLFSCYNGLFFLMRRNLNTSCRKKYMRRLFR